MRGWIGTTNGTVYHQAVHPSNFPGSEPESETIEDDPLFSFLVYNLLSLAWEEVDFYLDTKLHAWFWANYIPDAGQTGNVRTRTLTDAGYQRLQLYHRAKVVHTCGGAIEEEPGGSPPRWSTPSYHPDILMLYTPPECPPAPTCLIRDGAGHLSIDGSLPATNDTCDGMIGTEVITDETGYQRLKIKHLDPVDAVYNFLIYDTEGNPWEITLDGCGHVTGVEPPSQSPPSVSLSLSPSSPSSQPSPSSPSPSPSSPSSRSPSSPSPSSLSPSPSQSPSPSASPPSGSPPSPSASGSHPSASPPSGSPPSPSYSPPSGSPPSPSESPPSPSPSSPSPSSPSGPGCEPCVYCKERQPPCFMVVEFECDNGAGPFLLESTGPCHWEFIADGTIVEVELFSLGPPDVDPEYWRVTSRYSDYRVTAHYEKLYGEESGDSPGFQFDCNEDFLRKVFVIGFWEDIDDVCPTDQPYFNILSVY